MPFIDIFVLLSGTFSIIATVPLVYLAWRSHREALALRRIQAEVARLVVESKEIGEEVRELQRDIRRDQQAATDGIEEAKETVKEVARATERRRVLPRLRVEIG
jgi:cell division protein FtsB